MNKKKLAVILVDAGLVIFALVAKYIAAGMMAVLPDCPSAQRGILCPSCGATRCVKGFFSGQFSLAFSLHPYVFILILYLIGALVLINLGFLANRPLCRKIGTAMVSYTAIIILAIGYAIFGLLRAFVL